MQWQPVEFRRRFYRSLYSSTLMIVCLTLPARSHAQDAAALLEESLIKIVANSESSVVSISRFRPSPEDRLRTERRHLPFEEERPLTEMEMIPNEFGAGILVSLPK